MENDARQAEIDEILVDLHLSRDDAINDYRNFLDESGRAIHDGIRRLERDARRIRRNPTHAERLANDAVVAEADRIADLVRSYLSDLATLQQLGDASVQDAIVDMHSEMLRRLEATTAPVPD